MRHRLRQELEVTFPVTTEDWRDARHGEDPADRRNQADLERTLDMHDATPDRTLNTRAINKD